MRIRAGRIHNERQYTDLAVVLGPNVRWVENDVEDLLQYAPEVLNGYRVLPLTLDMVQHGKHRGLLISKIVLLQCDMRFTMAWDHAVGELYFSTSRAFYPKIEEYRVHRGLDPVVKRTG